MIGLVIYFAAAAAPATGPAAAVEIMSKPWTTLFNVAVSEEFIQKTGAQPIVLRDAELATRVLAKIRAAPSLPKARWPSHDDLRMLAVVKAADGAILSRVAIPRFCTSMHVDGARYASFDPELFAILVDRMSPDEKVMIAMGPKACRPSAARRASGVAGGKLLRALSVDEQTVFCDWRAGRLGGYAQRRACRKASVASGSTQKACVASLARLPASCTATVSTAESCTNALTDGCSAEAPTICDGLDGCRDH